ncbi:MAG: hypothetical protein P4L73_02710 [Caulobacteraceae bacterium]|nr:hypothetical protein [Caulobacteraceae bacterium]
MRRLAHAIDDRTILNYVRRGGRWIPKVRLRDWLWPIIVEWAAMTAVVWVILAIGFVAGLYRARPQLDAESRDFAETSVKAIAASWNPDDLLTRASPDFGSSVPDEWRRNLVGLKKLGGGVRREDCRGHAAINPLSKGNMVTARYLCAVSLQHADATIAMSLKDDADSWRIAGFYVEPSGLSAR